MRDPQKQETRAGGPGFLNDEKLLAGAFLLPFPTPAVNPNGRRLWATFRRYARNHRKIARLAAENEALLERLRQLQGVHV